ncbi:MAG TPA: flagellar hook-length control protein FliK [Phycisphaerales bacterium]|nr:flagellar hook-length control protein FliK [Phycisphaerales bacterium]
MPIHAIPPATPPAPPRQAVAPTPAKRSANASQTAPESQGSGFRTTLGKAWNQPKATAPSQVVAHKTPSASDVNDSPAADAPDDHVILPEAEVETDLMPLSEWEVNCTHSLPNAQLQPDEAQTQPMQVDAAQGVRDRNLVSQPILTDTPVDRAPSAQPEASLHAAQQQVRETDLPMAPASSSTINAEKTPQQEQSQKPEAILPDQQGTRSQNRSNREPDVQPVHSEKPARTTEPVVRTTPMLRPEHTEQQSGADSRSQKEQKPDAQSRGSLNWQPSQAPAAARAAQIEAALRAEAGAQQTASEPVRASTPSATMSVAPPQAPVTPTLAGSATIAFATGETGQELPASVRFEDDARFASRVIRGLTAMMNSRGGSLTMRLDPPELGQLRVHMSITQGVVAASFHAANPQAQALLEKNLAVLRTALEAQGLTVDRLHVQPSSGTSQQHAMSEDHSGQFGRHREDASEGESRGRREHRPSTGAGPSDFNGLPLEFAGALSAQQQGGLRS